MPAVAPSGHEARSPGDIAPYASKNASGWAKVNNVPRLSLSFWPEQTLELLARCTARAQEPQEPLSLAPSRQWARKAARSPHTDELHIQETDLR